jgi:phosphoribosylformylglycinamidine cyclo-ligase
MIKDKKVRLTYADAGVNIQAGNTLVEKIKPLAASTSRPGVIDSLGGFGALFDLKESGYIDPILVSATDGVGTKLKIAIDTKNCSTIGVDLVAMCVNDLLCQGAEPLFFLDYFATGRLNVEMATEVIKGVALGCKLSGCAMIGGETAEMPGIYREDDFDLAGFAVGAVDRGNILPSSIKARDVLLGIPSSGLHSNGFSLVRKIVEVSRLDLDAMSPFSDRTLGSELLEPTALYVKQILPLLKAKRIKGLAHITGGGIVENVPRVLPQGLTGVVDLDKWILPNIFDWLAHEGNLSENEMLSTFNCGIGIVLVVSAENELEVLSQLTEGGETPLKIGEIIEGEDMIFKGRLLK